MPYIGKRPSAGVRQRYQYTATAGQTTFSGTDLGNLTLTYTDNNFVDVFQNGVLLKGGGTDYTATSGTSVVLATGASVSDVIEIIVYDVFSVGNFYNRTDSDSRYVNHNSSTAGPDNFIAGNNAGNAIASGGNYNTLVGNEAGAALTTGDQNVAVGYQALDAIDEGIRNVAIGTTALTSDTKGEASTAIGHGALYAQNFTSSTASYNTAVGYHAGVNVTTGTQNTLMGSLVGDAITTGEKNTAVGYDALTALTAGDRNTAVGKGALTTFNVTDGSNTNNTAIGHDAGNDLTTGTNNTFIGAEAGAKATTSSHNVAIGYGSFGGVDASSANNGEQNTCIGRFAGRNLEGNADANTLVGDGAGENMTTGDDNICIGHDAGITGSPGGNITTGSYAIALGNNNISSFSCKVSLTATSDERDKTDFKDLDLGLDFVNDLKPVTYVWDSRINYVDTTKDDWKTTVDLDKITSDGSKKDDDLQVGFKAQDVIALEEAAGYKLSDKTNLTATVTNDGKQYGLSYERFVPMLVKAIQELSAKNDALEARIKKLEEG